MTTSANVNIYQVLNGSIEPNLSFYIACTTQAVLISALVGLIVYLVRNLPSLHKEELKARVGDSYQKFNVDRSGKSAIAVLASNHVRNLGLSLAITFGTGRLVAQIFYLNFSSLAILTLMGYLRPYNSRLTH